MARMPDESAPPSPDKGPQEPVDPDELEQETHPLPPEE